MALVDVAIVINLIIGTVVRWCFYKNIGDLDYACYRVTAFLFCLSIIKIILIAFSLIKISGLF